MISQRPLSFKADRRRKADLKVGLYVCLCLCR